MPVGGGGMREQAALAEGEEEESNIPVYGGSGPGMKKEWGGSGAEVEVYSLWA